MKFFQKTSVAVIFTVLMIAAALFIGLSPVLKSDKPVEAAQTAVPEQTISQTPAEEQTSNTAGDETISDKYIRDDAGLFTRSGEKAIRDYNDKIYRKTGSHIAILTTDGTGGKTLESCTNSAFDSMGLSEYDMLFAIDTSTEQWYVTTGSYVADYTDSKLESIFQDGFAAILDGDADDAASDMYKDLYNWCQTSLNGAADMEYTPAQDTGRGRRKSMIQLSRFWSFSGSSRPFSAPAAEAAEAEASGRACFWARCSRTIITTTAPDRGLAPDPAVSAAAPDPAAAAEAALAEAAEVSEEVEAGSAVAADKKFSSMNRPFAHILSPYLKKRGSFV